jgi:hypothetical protein
LNSVEQEKTGLLESKNYPIPEIKEEEPPKRGFWSKFFLPNG